MTAAPSLARALAEERDLPTLAAALDAAPTDVRLQAVRAVPARAQALLWDRCRMRPASLDRDFVAGRGPGVPVIHHGRNSLPLFRLFEKRFARAPAGDEVVGFNEQTWRPLTGPGYFVAREDELDGTRTVVIDYTRPVTARIDGWPAPMPNSARLSRFIYFGTMDWMWRVSSHVTIGRARRGDAWMDNWFLLCRED